MTQHQIKACEIISSKPSFGRIQIVKKTNSCYPQKNPYIVKANSANRFLSHWNKIQISLGLQKREGPASSNIKIQTHANMETWEAFLFLQMSKNGFVSTNRNFITVHLLPCSNLVDKWVEILLTYNENFQALLRQCTHAKNHRNLWGREGNFSGTSPPALRSLSDLSLLELK